MARWTQTPKEFERVIELIPGIATAFGPTGLSVRKNDGSDLHGTIGPSQVDYQYGGLNPTIPTAVAAAIVIHTDEGDVEVDLCDVQTYMVR